MFCKYCGKENDNDAKFCMHCGKAMVEEEKKDESGSAFESTAAPLASPVQTKTVSDAKPGDSDATASMILGIISIVICSSGILSFICGIMAVIISRKAVRLGTKSGNAQAGLICGIIGICLGSIIMISWIFRFSLEFVHCLF